VRRAPSSSSGLLLVSALAGVGMMGVHHRPSDSPERQPGGSPLKRARLALAVTASSSCAGYRSGPGDKATVIAFAQLDEIMETRHSRGAIAELGLRGNSRSRPSRRPGCRRRFRRHPATSSSMGGVPPLGASVRRVMELARQACEAHHHFKSTVVNVLEPHRAGVITRRLFNFTARIMRSPTRPSCRYRTTTPGTPTWSDGAYWSRANSCPAFQFLRREVLFHRLPHQIEDYPEATGRGLKGGGPGNCMNQIGYLLPDVRLATAAACN